MAISLKHAFTSNVADSGNTALVQPSNWNAEHTLTAAADTLLGAVTSGPVTEITCTAAGRAILDDADAAAQRTTLGLGTGDSPTFTDLNVSGFVKVGTGSTSTVTSVNIDKNHTGSTGVNGFAAFGEVQSDVTTRYTSFNSNLGTKDASFTLGNFSHFRASQATFGASSTVTSQYGYLSVGNLIGGVNNFAFAALDTAAVTSGKVAYGFHSSVNTATGGGATWAFYGAGTAPSYFAGQVQLAAGSVGTPSLAAFGDTNTGMWFPAADTIAWSTDGSERLRISSTGSITASGSLTAAGWSIATNTISTTSSAAFQPQINLVNTANDTTGPIWTTDKGRGVATPANSGDQLGQFLFRSYTSGGVASNAAQMQAISAGTTATGHAGQFRFVTRNTSDVFAERMRIDGAGNLGINTTVPDALLTVNGAASFGAGAVGTPSIAAFGDLNTGVWFPAADTVAVSTGGTEAMRVNSSQQLLVGGTTADAKLTVTGIGTTSTTPSTTTDIGATLGIRTSNGGAGNGGMLMFGATQGYFAAIKGFLQNGTGPLGALDFYTRNAGGDTTLTQRMRINFDGKIGIGTLSPDALLSVNGIASFGLGAVATPSISAFGDLNTGMWFPAADTIAWSTGGSERMRIDANGNVVVNTAAIATNATNGFFYVPSCAGTPTGTPTAFTGRVPIVVDTTNNKLYFYSGGQWRDAGP